MWGLGGKGPHAPYHNAQVAVVGLHRFAMPCMMPVRWGPWGAKPPKPPKQS